jgi:TolA-binding protein
MAIIKFSKKHKVKEDRFVEWIFDLRAKTKAMTKPLLIGTIVVVFVAGISALLYTIKSRTNEEANTLFGSALMEYQQGRYSNAVAKLKQVMDNYSGSNSAPKAVFLFGSIYYDIGNYMLSIEAYKKYLEKYDPPDFLTPAVYKGLGCDYMQLKDYANAISAFRTALKKFPNDFQVPEIRYKLARCLAETGKADAAKAELNEILQESPKSFYAKEAGLLLASL